MDLTDRFKIRFILKYFNDSYVWLIYESIFVKAVNPLSLVRKMGMEYFSVSVPIMILENIFERGDFFVIFLKYKSPLWHIVGGNNLLDSDNPDFRSYDYPTFESWQII